MVVPAPDSTNAIPAPATKAVRPVSILFIHEVMVVTLLLGGSGTRILATWKPSALAFGRDPTGSFAGLGRGAWMHLRPGCIDSRRGEPRVFAAGADGCVRGCRRARHM